jgi:hypothetical protein
MKQYDVFFSHSTRTDPDTTTEKVMEMVYACLTGHRRGVYWDRKCLSAGKLLPVELRDVIRNSRIAVFFVTGAAGKSSWVEFELEAARASQTQVRAVLLDGVKRPAWFLAAELIRLQNATTQEGIALLVCREALRLLDSH